MNEPRLSDDEALAQLATQLGLVSGALTRPAVQAGLVDMLRGPYAQPTRRALAETYRVLGEVLDALNPPPSPSDVG